MFEGQNYKKQARMQLAQHWKVPLLIGLTISAFFAVVSFVSILNQQNQINSMAMMTETGDMSYLYNMLAFYMIIGLIAYLVSGIIYMAISHFYLSFAKDNNNSTFSTFLEGFAFWSKGARGSLWMYLWVCLWALLFYMGIIRFKAF